MKDIVQCRKLRAKFRQLAVTDPNNRLLWLAEAAKWEREAEAEIASLFEACNAVRPVGAVNATAPGFACARGGRGSANSRLKSHSAHQS
jgi:hypothetical protein